MRVQHAAEEMGGDRRILIVEKPVGRYSTEQRNNGGLVFLRARIGEDLARHLPVRKRDELRWRCRVPFKKDAGSRRDSSVIPAGQRCLVHTQERSVAVGERARDGSKFRKQFHSLRAERGRPELSPGIDGAAIKFEKRRLIGVKFQTQSLSPVAGRRFAALRRAKKKQPALALGNTCRGYRHKSQSRRGKVQQTREKDCRESDFILTERFR